MVRARRHQFVAVVPAGLHDDRLGANCTCTFHIKGRVPDDPDMGGVNGPSNMALGLNQGVSSHVVAVIQSIGEAAEREELPQTKVPQLDLGSCADVSGEQTDDCACRSPLRAASIPGSTSPPLRRSISGRCDR